MDPHTPEPFSPVAETTYNTAREFDSMESQLNSIAIEINKLSLLMKMRQINSHFNSYNIDPAQPDRNQKSMNKAEKLREEGNNAYVRSKNNEKALLLYTQSLAYAPPQSQAYAVAHANRSAVLKDMSLFVESIVEAQRALKANYVEQLIYKLHIRQGKCYKKLREMGKAVKCFNNAIQSLDNLAEMNSTSKEKMKNKIQLEIETCGRNIKAEPLEDLTLDFNIGVPDFIIDVPRFASKCNPEVPAAAACLSLKYNKQFGRHFVANRDILPGEVLMIEEPFAALLQPDLTFTHCSHCMKRSCTLLPCQNCTWAMFCSVSCIEASHTWHQHECAIMPNANKIRDDVIVKLSARVIFTAGSANLTKYFDELRQVDVNKFKTNEEYRTEGFNENGKYLSCDVKTVGHLCFHEPKNSSDIEMYSYLATIIMDIFDLKIAPKIDLLNFISKLALSYVYNYTYVTEYHKKGKREFYVTLASALYPTHALLNHSCFPNTVDNFYGKTLVVRALRTILKGEQVFTCMFNCSYFNFPKNERQEMLHKAYFNCHCVACDNKWPIMSELPPFPVFGKDERDSKAKAKYDCSLSKLMRNVKTKSAHWQVTRENIALFHKHLVVMDKWSQVKNQHYMHMVMCLKKFYIPHGNCVLEKSDV